MLNLKYLTQISLIAFIAVMAVVAPIKAKAQDDMGGDEDAIMPPIPNDNIPQPPPIDDSDSGSISDIEEYDG